MSEDRVRDAVRAVFDVIHTESNVFFPPPGVYARCSAALRPYVTPATAIPPGTMAVSVDTLREWSHSLSTYIRGSNAGVTRDSIEAVLHRLPQLPKPPRPGPPRPEPPDRLVAGWQKLAKTLAGESFKDEDLDSEQADCFRCGVIAVLRSEWEAEQGGA